MSRIFRTARPSATGGPVLPMNRADALAWELTRKLHPHLYADKCRQNGGGKARL